MANLSELPNIGKVLEQDLIKAGIKTPAELKDVGSKEAFLRIWENDSSVCLSELCALEGAVQGGYSGLTWATPFFGFVVLVALGIDYSIFLMSRFNEYNGLSVRDRMIKAMKNMGGVIFSAVIILGGTFAAMMPAGVLSLLEIATVVLIA